MTQASSTTQARTAVLERIRAAIGSPKTSLQIPRAYRLETGTSDLIGLLEERIADYRATVHLCDSSKLSQTIAEILERLHVKCLAVPADLPADWIPANLKRLTDRADLEPRSLETADAVLTVLST